MNIPTWFKETPPGRFALRIGTFILTYCSLGSLYVGIMLQIGVNPTLVMSIVAAPIWIFLLWISYRITKILIDGLDK